MPQVITRAEWGAVPAKAGPGPLLASRVEGLAFHWPGISEPMREIKVVSAALRGWQHFHMVTKGWSDIAYQVAIDQDGNVYLLRGLATQSGANGDTDVNQRFGAVLLILAPGEVPSLAMITSVRSVVTDHRVLFPKSKQLVGHRNVRPEPTDCPGDVVMAAITKGTFEPVVIPPPPVVKPKMTRGRYVDPLVRATREALTKIRNPIKLAKVRESLAALRKINRKEK